MEKMIGRVTGFLGVALLILMFGGCSLITGMTQKDADVRKNLADGLAEMRPDEAEWVRSSDATLTLVEATWLHGWQVFDVYVFLAPHPQRFYAALSDDGTALVLSGSSDSFLQMIRSAQIVVDNASAAADIGTLYLDVTRDFYRWSYRIDSLSDIQWVLTPDREQQRIEIEAQYGALVQPPAPEPSDSGWSITVWMVYDLSLIRHHLLISADGAVQDTPDVVETDMPVPESF
ncbi:MAG: hypothetical protein FWG14_07165 [Peptococcaceae bacterium]|nr:hypothetical protein [Peptococcaceae bacterium]